MKKVTYTNDNSNNGANTELYTSIIDGYCNVSIEESNSDDVFTYQFIHLDIDSLEALIEQLSEQLNEMKNGKK